MRAADTNLLVRLVTGDDPVQERSVIGLLAAEWLYVPLTVAMELEWVLRSVYRMTKAADANAILALTSLEGLVFEQVDLVRWACSRLAQGAEFDDPIHVVAAAAADAEALVTFDRTIVRHAGETPPIQIDVLT